MKVKPNNLAKQNKDILSHIQRVLVSGKYILDKEVECFEREFATYCGIKYGCGVGSGTDALVLAMMALGIGPGEKVIVPSFTPIPTVSAITQIGAKPVFADIEADTLTIDPIEVEKHADDDEVVAVMPVHLFGQMADMVEIRSIANNHNLFVIEDACQAHGAERDEFKPGWNSDVACFSFYPTKNLGGIGDGGMVITNDAYIDQQVRSLRQYGWDEFRISHTQGFNSRLDEIQAAVLRMKLLKLNDDNKRRQDIGKAYCNYLSDLVGCPSIKGHHVFHQYAVRIPHGRRSALMFSLEDKGIWTSSNCSLPAHCHPSFYFGGQHLRETNKAAEQVMSLPCYPEMTDEQVEYVIEMVKEFFGD